MNAYIFASAPSGVGLSNVVTSLEKNLNVKVEDIEKVLTELPETDAALEQIDATFDPPINMEIVAHYLPRLKVRKLWELAVSQCLGNLYKSDRDIKILSGHLVYYGGQRNEFYSVINPNSLVLKKKDQIVLSPTRVLLFIDDLFDMYARLPDLYSTDHLKSFINRLAKNMKIEPSDLSKERLLSLTMGWEVRNLLHLLSWRHLESVLAEHLAVQLGAQFLVWAVKQLKAPLELWINANSTPIYLSHPISEARREEKAKGNWSEYTEEINQLQEILFKQGITLVMPTGIDEFRLEEKDYRYTGNLEDRWPLITDDMDKILYSIPDGVPDINYKTSLSPKYWDFSTKELANLESGEFNENLGRERNSALQVMAREIEAQIASRDFLIIYHSAGLLVFRPYFSRNPRREISSGVKAEIELWGDIVSLGLDKRIAFIHYEEDVRSVLRARSKDREGAIELLKDLADTVWGPMYKTYGISRSVVGNLVRNKGELGEVQDILNIKQFPQSVQENIKKAFPEFWRQGKVDQLKKYLINPVGVKKQELVGVWVVTDFESATVELENIAKFLKKGNPDGNGWESRIEELFPDDLAYNKPQKK